MIVSMPARADVFVYHDQQDRFTVSFADSWRVVANRNADDALVIAAPGREDHALCRVRVRTGKRYTIFPHHLRDEAQRIAYGADFWSDYFLQYDNVSVRRVSEHAGLGRGPASFAEAYYTPPGVDVRKRAIAFASLYAGKAYIVECSSAAYSYEHWKPQFMNLIKSVDFDKSLHEYPSANYRMFLADPTLEIRGDQKIKSSYY